MSKTLIIMRDAETAANRDLTPQGARQVDRIAQQLLVQGIVPDTVVQDKSLSASATAEEAFNALTGRGLAPDRAKVDFNTGKAPDGVGALDRLPLQADTALIVLSQTDSARLVQAFVSVSNIKYPGSAMMLESPAQSWGDFAADGRRGKIAKVFR